MSGIQHPTGARCFTFATTVAGFLSCPGLPFVDILSETRIQRVFARHHNLFGRTYSTAIVLWAFMSQVLRDGKEASCQSAVGRNSSYLARHGLGDVDPDTRDYCRARAKLSEAAVRELSREIADESERLVQQEHLFKNRHAKLIDGSTCIMADTPANQNAYPQNPTQKPGVGFPIARFVVVVSLATACVIDAAMVNSSAMSGIGRVDMLMPSVGISNYRRNWISPKRRFDNSKRNDSANNLKKRAAPTGPTNSMIRSSLSLQKTSGATTRSAGSQAK